MRERWPHAVQRLVKRDTEAELVGSRVERLAAELLGCHVGRRAQEGAGLGDGVVAPHSGGSQSGVRLAGRLLIAEPRQAEVHDPHRPVAADHDVLRFEIAVHDSGRVCRREPAARVKEHFEDVSPASVRRSQPTVERLALDELHRDVDVADVASVVHGHDIGVR